MRNGQITKDTDQMLFSGAITPGSGELPEDVNPDTAYSVNSGAYSPSRNSSNIGVAAMASVEGAPSNHRSEEAAEINGELISRPESATSNLELTPAPAINPDYGPKLGEVIEANPSSTEKTEEFNIDGTKTDKILSDAAVKKIEVKLIRKFNSDKNAEDFYRDARGAMIAHIRQSYGESANWKGGAA